HGSKLTPGESYKYDDIKKVVKQASEDSLKGILCYTEDQVSPVTSTVTHILPPPMWGLALLSMTTLS
ncbi:Hypothetical predicted protein, partial [Lynx pardinus]